MPFELIITPVGYFFMATMGTVTFFIMRFAHRIVEDPDFEKKVYSKNKKRK